MAFKESQKNAPEWHPAKSQPAQALPPFTHTHTHSDFSYRKYMKVVREMEEKRIQPHTGREVLAPNRESLSSKQPWTACSGGR